MPQPPPPDPNLPTDLLEFFAERFFAVTVAERAGVLQELAAAHPGHASALERLAGDLANADRLLGKGYGPTPADHPTSIGGYHVTRRLGEGAFGVVYLCTQETPVRREVAVKVLRPGAGDRSSLQRFEAERQFLARMSHPAITQVFDAGLLPDGRPYFAMEYVRGLPITEFCDQHGLAVEARLDLFVRLCQGVQHAHEHGILHRDLKPANILVVEVDGVAQPKIIDFGIARALQHEGDQAAFRTDTGRVVGTPGYMSPEQAGGRREEIDARTDMFSLGAILYELLTGDLPWGRRPTSSDSEPPRPSQRVTRDPTRTAEIARRRGSQPRRLVSRLRGELDWIVLKAVALAREHRYQSAHDLVVEIGRHLHHEPVLAGPPTIGYRLRKVLRRHRTALSTMATILVMAIGGLAFTAHYRAEAKTRSGEAAAAVAGLLARANDPRVIASPNSTELRKTLAKDALDFYDLFLGERPTSLELREGRARTLWTLSQVHWLLGQYGQAVTIGREAVSESDALLAERPGDLKFRGVLGNACRILGRALYSSGQAVEARPQFQRATELFEGCYAESPTKYDGLTVCALLELQSTMDQGTEAAGCSALLERASKLQNEIISRQPDAVAERSALLTIDLQRVSLLVRSGNVAAATQLIQQEDEQLAKTPDMEPSAVTSLHMVAADLHSYTGDHAAAIARLQPALAFARQWCDREPSKAQPMTQLVSIYWRLANEQQQAGDQAAATANWQTAVELGETRLSRFPEDQLAPVELAWSISSLALALESRGRRSASADKARLVSRGVELLGQIAPTVDAEMRIRLRWTVLGNLAPLLDGDPSTRTEAAGLWQQTSTALLVWHKQFGISPDHAPTFERCILPLARFRLATGDEPAASALLQLVQPPIDPQSGSPTGFPGDPEVFRLRALLAAQRGNPKAAAEQAELAAAANAGWFGSLAAARAMHAAWQAALGAGQPGASYRDRAIELHRVAIADLEEQVAQSPDDLWIVVPLARVRIQLAMALADRGERTEATTLADTAIHTLTAVRDETLACEWDAPLFHAGQTLCAR